MSAKQSKESLCCQEPKLLKKKTTSFRSVESRSPAPLQNALAINRLDKHPCLLSLFARLATTSKSTRRWNGIARGHKRTSSFGWCTRNWRHAQHLLCVRLCGFTTKPCW